MSALSDPVYLLLNDKTDRAGVLMIIYIKDLSQKVRILIYFIFAMQLMLGIDPLYQPDYLTHSITATIYIYAVIHAYLICIELGD